MFLQQPFKESLCCFTITPFLKKHINNLSIPKALASLMGQALPTALASLMGQAFLINCSPQVILLAINLNENFIDIECIAIPTMFFL
jgi:hypothetical protein